MESLEGFALRSKVDKEHLLHSFLRSNSCSDTVIIFCFLVVYTIGEGNGNPLQCSCLENPRDRGAWWAAVYGVAQSRTRLK